MVCNWLWFGRTVTGLYCNRVRIGAERFALKVNSLLSFRHYRLALESHGSAAIGPGDKAIAILVICIGSGSGGGGGGGGRGGICPHKINHVGA